MYNKIKEFINNSEDKQVVITEIRKLLFDLSNNQTQPIDYVMWIQIDKVELNEYNPNSVAGVELDLLYKSILADGYTQPIVTIFDKERNKYIIVDGFHRYFVAKNKADILSRTNGLIPIVVINKDINNRMASTVRHNRARGSHSVVGMSNMVFKMLENGWGDEEICKELGMGKDEILRLKHITGFSKLFANVEYRKAWETKNQIIIRKQSKYEY